MTHDDYTGEWKGFCRKCQSYRWLERSGYCEPCMTCECGERLEDPEWHDRCDACDHALHMQDLREGRMSERDEMLFDDMHRRAREL